MLYSFLVKNCPLRRGGIAALVVLAALFVTALPRQASARSSFWISSRDTKACIVSAVIQYDQKLEAQVRQDNGITNVILQMDVHTKEPQELCSMLQMNQGVNIWRPLLCVTSIRGNIYQGYLILPEGFSLDNPIQIHLGDRSVDAQFVK